MRATVAVIIATIPPRAGLLAEALTSVLAQTRPADEIRVVTDTAGDGPAATRNWALRPCSADWVAFLDDDDTWKPGHLEALVGCAEQTGADLVYPWFDVVGGTDPFPDRFGQPFDDDAAVALRDTNWIPVTFLARRALLDQVGGFPTPGTHPHADQEEWALQLRLLDIGATFVHLPERTWRWRHWHGNTSGRPWTQST